MPKSKWFKITGTLHGWAKNKTPHQRRIALSRAVRADGYKDVLKRMIAIHNVTTDIPTKRTLKADINYLRIHYG